MAPRSRKRNESPPRDPEGMFAGMFVFFVENGVSKARLQIWKTKLYQMGATTEDTFSKRVTNVFANDSDSLLQKLGRQQLLRFKGNVLRYEWIMDSLKLGERVSEDSYVLSLDTGEGESLTNSSVPKNSKSANRNNSTVDETFPKSAKGKGSSGDEMTQHKRIRTTSEDSRSAISEDREVIINNAVSEAPNSGSKSGDSFHYLSPEIDSPIISGVQDKNVSSSESSLHYKPPDLNKNITEIFGKLINIYRALGDDRRSFSYYKAIPVIEKLPFKIENVEQLKHMHLPAIGKSMQDHIQQIVTTGKLSKLEHFETDEKVRTISLFGEVWGIGPATAVKLYDKGYRTLDDLNNESSLTYAQRMGLKYFDDIKTRIPRHEVQEMERLLQKVGEIILPGLVILCGGSFRRGKASCGDMDIIITHPDGKGYIFLLFLLPWIPIFCSRSIRNFQVHAYVKFYKKQNLIHRGFLPKYVKHLKDMKFLREDLVVSIHSEEGTDSRVDTYFGLCTYPGRQLRHRIDVKVYPRDIYAFGLIAWTGNDVLNRRLRLLAEAKGFRLDDTGLFPSTQSSGGKRGTRASASLKFETENEVFDFLGFPRLEPHERNL